MCDLLDNTPFKKEDIITIQDPTDMETKALANFHYLQEGLSVEEAVSGDATRNINASASTSRILSTLKAKAADGTSLADNNSVLGDVLTLSSTKEEERAGGNAKRAQAPGFTSTSFVPSQMAAIDPRTVINKTDKKGFVRLVTSMGDLNLELHCDLVPKTCENFLLLASRKYYDGTVFHRLIKNFMVQGGDPTGTGSGGASAYGVDKPVRDEFHHTLTHSAIGVVSVANKGPNTGSSQFFITFKTAPHLDRKHSVFGRVVGGLEVLRAIERVPVDDDDRPVTPIVLKEVIVFVNPLSEESLAQAAQEKAAVEQAKIDDEMKRHDLTLRGAWFRSVGKYLRDKSGLDVAVDTRQPALTAAVSKLAPTAATAATTVTSNSGNSSVSAVAVVGTKRALEPAEGTLAAERAKLAKLTASASVSAVSGGAATDRAALAAALSTSSLMPASVKSVQARSTHKLNDFSAW